MKILESKPKSFIFTFLVYLLVIFEMGVLSGFRFCVPTAKYVDGLTKLDVANISAVGKVVGWNFVVVSCLIILALWGVSMLFGYNRNPGGMLAMVLMNLLPLIGLGYGFNFFYGYGTAHLLPAMSIFGVHNASRATQIIFIAAVTVLIILFWLLGNKIRSIHAEKYEIEI